MGAGVSVVDENFDAFEDVSHDADEHKPGLNVRGGYRFHPRFAAELALQTYSAFEVEIASAADGEIEGWALTANLKGYLATGRLQPYGLLGLGYSDTDNSSGVGEDGSDPLVAAGLGADYYLNRRVFLYLELAYYHPVGDTDEFDFIPLTLGLSYRF